MTSPSHTYVPRKAHQPRGGRPWCSTCRTDRHLLAGSVTVLDSRKDTLALAVTCTRCGGSRVLETTAALAAGIQGRAEKVAVSDPVSAPVHCREPMPSVSRSVNTANGQTGPLYKQGGFFPARVLRCRCGFQMDAPAGRRPNPPIGRRKMRTP